MNFIERYEDYKHNEFVMKTFLEAQLAFVGFYVYAIFFFKSIEVYVFIMTMMVGLPIVFNDRFYSLFSASMVVIFPILTTFFIEKIVELNANSTVFISIIVVILSIIGQIVFISIGLTNLKELLERLKNKGELEDKIVLEKDEDVIETNSVNKINSLIKRGYKYNKEELRKALIK